MRLYADVDKEDVTTIMTWLSWQSRTHASDPKFSAREVLHSCLLAKVAEAVAEIREELRANSIESPQNVEDAVRKKYGLRPR